MRKTDHIQSLNARLYFRPLRMGLVVGGVTLLGVMSLIITHAATYAGSAEAEYGTLSGNASKVSDSNASGGQAVKFGSVSSSSSSSSRGGGEATTSSWWKPTSSASISWNWVIGNPPPSPYKKVAVYDIDGFNNPSSTVQALHDQNTKVICYIDVGTYEPGRPDLNLIPTADIGSGVQGWPGEKWLNIADISGLTPIVTERMNLCKSKGFDAIEPDNIDGYTNSTGFPLTAANQLAYNKFLANTAHSLGMSIGLKNDVDQTAQLQPFFDWALDEECNKYTECNTLAPFTLANKAVFNAEYTDDGETTSKFCSADAAAHINGALYNLNLDGTVYQPCTGTW